MTRNTTRAGALWAAFLAAHVLVAWLGWVLPAQPMGDVVLVYQPWSSAALAGETVVGITQPWVYPQLALVPMLLAQVLAAPFTATFGIAGAYLIGWAILVTACDLLAFAVLVGRGRTRRRRQAAWFWIGALVLLGPIALYRIDAITVPIAVAGGLWLAQRPRIGAALLTIGAWVKIWPGALVLAAAAAGRRSWQIILTAASVSAALVGALVLLGAGEHVFGFLTTQAGRGLQIEAVAATPFLWLAVVGAVRIEYSFEILTFQIVAPAADAVSSSLTVVMAAAIVALVVAGVAQARAGAAWQRLLPPLSLALVVALIVTNKVGSPQFTTWLLPPVILWLVFDRPRARSAAALVLALCALTFAIYPLAYDALLRAEPAAVLVVTVRNLLLVVLLVHSTWAVMRAPRASASARPSRTVR